ncbi:hypothetical protein EMIT043CA1_150055 [Pseudomonas brassicacearum]
MPAAWRQKWRLSPLQASLLGLFGQAHGGWKAPHSRPHGLRLKTDERPPCHGKPPISKLFQRYRLAQESPPKYG